MKRISVKLELWCLLSVKWLQNLSLIKSLIDFINPLIFWKFYYQFCVKVYHTFLKVTSTMIDQSSLSAIVDLVFGEFYSLKDLALNHVSRRIGRDRENIASGLDREALRNEVNC